MSRSLLGLAVARCVKAGPTRANLPLVSAMLALWESCQAQNELAVSRAQQANSL